VGARSVSCIPKGSFVAKCVPIDAQLVQQALRAGLCWQLSHRDSLVVEAARQSARSRGLTHDLANGAAYDGLVIEIPFR
jgi:predicted nucleic acid-binding protein